MQIFQKYVCSAINISAYGFHIYNLIYEHNGLLVRAITAFAQRHIFNTLRHQ